MIQHTIVNIKTNYLGLKEKILEKTHLVQTELMRGVDSHHGVRYSISARTKLDRGSSVQPFATTELRQGLVSLWVKFVTILSEPARICTQGLLPSKWML